MAFSQGNINFKENKFTTITWDEIRNGIIDVHNSDIFSLVNNDNDGISEDSSKKVIIALKTIETKFLDGSSVKNNIDEMTSIFFMPAKVYKDGTLGYQDDKYSWIPREYLSPMIEPQIAIGKAEDYDIFLEESTDKRNQIDSWGNYLEYCIEMYEFITKSKFSEDLLVEQQIQTDGKFYVFKDETIGSTCHLMNLYNHLIVGNETKLYSRITSGDIEPSKPIRNKLDYDKMIYHSGQMGGEYPLSPSQREAISCFEEIEEGDVLAVNGPPGTGKTTLLQTIVADMYVKAALQRNEAPIIVAASTNNKAVTNIIDSFGKINPVGIRNLEKRWITGVHSFAVYFPTKGKIKEAQNKKYHYTSVNGTGFVEEIESADNRQKATEFFEEEYYKYFEKKIVSWEMTKENIHKELLKIQKQRIEGIKYLERVKQTIGNNTTGEYISRLKEQIFDLSQKIEVQEDKIDACKLNGEKLKSRSKEWRELYNKLPWYVRLLKFIPYFKKRIISWSHQNMNYEELNFLNRGMDIVEIESRYNQRISENDQKLKKLGHNLENLKNDKHKQEKKRDYIYDLIEKAIKHFNGFSIYNVRLEEGQFWDNINVETINNALDRVRYVEFWMAVHYYEALWLSEEWDISEKQRGRTFENVLDTMYHRLAMLTPCMVMTCFMLPKQFLAYDGNEKTHYYMYNYADLLIVDEAGQISPEIGVPAFALAKKAVVVGDEYQIPPVWGTVRALDIAMAISNDVIHDKNGFVWNEQCGLNCSQSSIMKIAAQSCKFEKYGKGLFLSEHRRCYNEIIQYCNKLVYGGCLEPLRGAAVADKNNPIINLLPPMGHKQIDSTSSERSGTSRYNKNEIEGIIQWIGKNYFILCEKYREVAIKKNEQFDKNSVLGIITPFKSQSSMIKQGLREYLPEIADDIEVGTVHTFQGAERKVVIFSSVYGNKDGCYFINKNKSLMNVAVSRAKDSFLVFGDRGCLVGEAKSAGVMLRVATEEEI